LGFNVKLFEILPVAFTVVGLSTWGPNHSSISQVMANKENKIKFPKRKKRKALWRSNNEAK
jgi:hypothetical protein